MTEIIQLDLASKTDIRDFIEFPFTLYKDNPLWVPPIRADIRKMLDPAKHPYYEHSEAAFFLARQDGRVVGRLGVLENRPFNEYQKKKQAQFYFFECIQEYEIAQQLFDAAAGWARSCGLIHMVGEKGLSSFDGYGLLVAGFEYPPSMTMMKYNPPYYGEYLEQMGFTKEVDFITRYVNLDIYDLPERVHRISERAMNRSGIRIVQFSTKKELLSWGKKIGQVYNDTFVNNWEYYPLTQNELDFAINDALMVADPKLIKIILHEERIIGFILAFPDVSNALRRANGRLLPWSLVDLLMEFKRTKLVAINGMGILPEYQGRGGNAIMYSELYKTIREFGFHEADLCQVAETATMMSRDLTGMGGMPRKVHRVYTREL
jgi:GNAT superfamily N-acetyltransferase